MNKTTKINHYWQWTAAAAVAERAAAAVAERAAQSQAILTDSEIVQIEQRARRLIYRGKMSEYTLRCAFDYVADNNSERAAAADRRRRIERADAERADAERAARLAAVYALETDDTRAERVKAERAAVAERAAAAPSKKYVAVDFSAIPVVKFDYITKKGQPRTIYALSDNSTAAAVLNALKVCRSVIRQRLRMISKNSGATIPKKLVDRLTRFKTQYGKLSAAYIRGATDNDITAVYTALAVDDSECYEMLSTALTVILSAPVSLDIMRGAQSLVKRYLESEKKDDSARAFSLDDIADSDSDSERERAAAAPIEYISYQNWQLTAAAPIKRERERADRIRAAVCAVLAIMRRYQRAAVLQYGIQRDILSGQRAGGISRGGYAPTAAVLNEYLTVEQRAALFNCDISAARRRGQYEYNTAAVRHSVETFRAAFLAKYQYILRG